MINSKAIGNYYQNKSPCFSGKSQEEKEIKRILDKNWPSNKPFSTVDPGVSDIKDHTRLINYVKKHKPEKLKLKMPLNRESYNVSPQNKEVKELLINGIPTIKELDEIDKFFKKNKVTELITYNDLTSAIASPDKKFEGYENVWIRDAVWSSIALSSSDDVSQKQATKIILKLADYLSTKKQVQRFIGTIKFPEPVINPNMSGDEADCVHIRFDAKSLDDPLKPDGTPQGWMNHQNDALGIFYNELFNQIKSGKIKADELKDIFLETIILYPIYMNRIDFSNVKDYGTWEEQPKVNTSSISFVTESLENFQKLLFSDEFKDNKNVQQFRDIYFSKLQDYQKNKMKYLLECTPKTDGSINVLSPIEKRKVKEFFNKTKLEENLNLMVDKGYKKIKQQLDAGGESPAKSKIDEDPIRSKTRTTDSALLGLIYPLNLKRLDVKDKEKIINSIESQLVGDMGVKRYIKDFYQATMYWFRDYMNGNKIGDLLNNVRMKDLVKSNPHNIDWLCGIIPAIPKEVKNYEPQWFFDSWISAAYGKLYQETGKKEYLEKEIKHFNRSMCQITGDNMLAANGKPIEKYSLPESYNVFYHKDKEYYVPSPITPLNWSKSCITLALSILKENINSISSNDNY